MNFGRKYSKCQSPDKTPYTLYYPHSDFTDQLTSVNKSNVLNLLNPSYKSEKYIQIVSIDPGIKNYAFRIERRYKNGWITPVVFDKWKLSDSIIMSDCTINHTFQSLTNFLLKYKDFILKSHFIIIERQLPHNYKATRISQHTISFFSFFLANNSLRSLIFEIDPKLKGKLLHSPPNINEKQLKTWAVEKAIELLNIRKDIFSLNILSHYKSKKDDLADTICQIEALFIFLNLGTTSAPPPPPQSSNLKLNFL